jgi:membrane protein
MSRPERIARARALVTSARRLIGALDSERLQLRAMALTFLSLFALVPGLVVAFSVVQAFTGMAAIRQRLDEFVLSNLAVGARASIEPYLTRFVKNAHAASAGLVGFALLLWSALSLFQNVEHALNDIWHVRRRRPLKQLVLTYWAGLTLGPILLAGSLTLGHAVQGFLAHAPVGRIAAQTGAFFLTCAFFGTLYLIVPATKVRPRAAVAGGVLAGLAFEIAKAAYTYAVARFFRYHVVYGSVAAVPIFLLWLHVSWMILLGGARVAFVVQHARVLLRGHVAEATPLGRERLAARALLEIALAFQRGAPAPQPEEVADRLDVLPEPVRDVLAVLSRAGLVVELASGGVVPGRPLGRITLADVRAALTGPGQGGDVPAAVSPALAPLAAAEGSAAAALAQVTYEELCARTAVTLEPSPEYPAGRPPVQKSALQ